LGCRETACRPPSLDTLLQVHALLGSDWDWSSIAADFAGPPGGLKRQLEVGRRIVAASILAVIAEEGGPTSALFEWACRACGQDSGLPTPPIASPTDAVPIARVRHCFGEIALQLPDRLALVAAAHDATLLFLQAARGDGADEGGAFREVQVPILLAQRKVGHLAWLWLEQVDHGFGQLFRAPETALDPLQPDLLEALEAAWRYVVEAQGAPTGGVRWRLLSLPSAPDGEPFPVQGASLQAAGVVGLLLLLSGRPYNPTHAISATVSTDGRLGPVRGIVEGDSPKLAAAVELNTADCPATVVVSADLRLSRDLRATWERRGVRLLCLETVSDAVTRMCGMPATTLHNLPVLASSFVGRDREIEAIHRLLSIHRLVTLSGPGGIGKSRLALGLSQNLVRRYQHGVWLVELASLGDEKLIPQVIAAALGIPAASFGPPLEALLDSLRHREMVLILDNCEHVIDYCAVTVETILQRCPRVRVLCTSREALRVDGETVFPLSGLAAPPARPLVSATTEARAGAGRFEAVELFLQRAAQANPDFRCSPQDEAVAEVCRRLDGIPLAIELAAARVRILSPEQLVERLSDRFRLLSEGKRTSGPRQQTLRGAFDWSFDLLTRAEQLLFCRLSVFNGPFNLRAVEAICAGDDLSPVAIESLISSLLAKSLVITRERQGRAELQLLETLRAYAGERLAEREVPAAVQQRHMHYYRQVALAEGALLEGEAGEAQTAALRTLDGSLDNLRAALGWAFENEPFAALEIVRGLGLHWLSKGYWAEARAAHDRALRLAREASPELRARVVRRSGLFAMIQGDYERAWADATEALEIYHQAGDEFGCATCLFSLGNIESRRGNTPRARELLQETLGRFSRLSRGSGMADTHDALATLEITSGHFAAARSHLEACLELNRSSGRTRGVAISHRLLGYLAQLEGDLAAARTHFSESGRYLDEDDDPAIRATLLQCQGLEARARRDEHAARIHLEQSLALWRTVGSREYIAMVTMHLATLDLAGGNIREALPALEGVAETFRALGADRGLAEALHYVGIAYLMLQDLPRARQFLAESLDIRLRVEQRTGWPESLEACACLAAAAGETERAARLHGASHKVREEIGMATSPWDVDCLPATWRDLCAHQTVDLFARGIQEGRSLTVEEWTVEARLFLARSDAASPASLRSGASSATSLKNLPPARVPLSGVERR